MRRIWWITLSIGLLVLSAIAVLARLSGYYYVPQPLGHALDAFIGPGDLIWWITLGGVFDGFPTTSLGYRVRVLRNTSACPRVLGAAILALRGASSASRDLSMP